MPGDWASPDRERLAIPTCPNLNTETVHNEIYTCTLCAIAVFICSSRLCGEFNATVASVASLDTTSCHTTLCEEAPWLATCQEFERILMYLTAAAGEQANSVHG